MGLFDGGLDMDSIMQMLNPIGSAQAAGGAFGNTGGITPEQLLQSQSATNPIVPPPEPPGSPGVPRGITSEPITPTPPAPTFNDTSGLPPQRMQGSTFGPGGPPPMGNGAGAPLTAPGAIGAALRGEPVPGAVGPTSVGGAPLAAPATPSGNTDVSARAKTEEEKRPSLAQALKGVQAPKPPELQKISSPNAPRPTGTIKGGDLQALLMALNAGVPALAGRQLPVTLGRG